MGKAYTSELASLEATYRFCLDTNTTDIEQFIAKTRKLPLICVGSGGSIAVAQFAAMLHEHYSQTVGRASTPLDVANSGAIARSAILFLTAGGRHPDVLGSFRKVAECEPAALAALCASPGSPLEALAHRYSFAQYLPFSLPSGKDGFLATNSLLAFCVLLLRSWRRSFGIPEGLPTLDEVDRRVGLNKLLRASEQAASTAWNHANFLILHGPWGTPAALDFESRFHEAGIGAVQVADLRNFAHGRHYWLTRRGAETCIICLTSVEDEDLGTRTLKLLPKDIARVRISIANSGPVAAIGLLIVSLYLAGWASATQEVDPGRPSVPHFGRRIYRLNAWHRGAQNKIDLRNRILERKTKRSTAELESADVGRQWHEALGSFVARLKKARFGGLVCDYDGTVCAPEYRYTQPPASICKLMNDMLAAGLPIGIATGRGKSVKKSLREVIGKAYWHRLIIGYYNGSQVARLDEDDVPIAGEPIGDLRAFSQRLRSEPALWHMVTVEERRDQLTIEAKSPGDTDDALRWIRHLLQASGANVEAVASSRSIDIIQKGTSKQSVVTAVQKLQTKNIPVLCIGDAGEWPGNDFVLLANDYSLSAMFTSPDPRTCWNLAPPGVRGADATALYLRSLKVRNGVARLESGLLTI